MVAENSYEYLVVDQLKGYKRLERRIKKLEQLPIGNGMFLSSSNEDDKLQDLHRKLKGLPSYMYLSKREQEIEQTATALLEKYPIGIRNQLDEVRSTPAWDPEDQKNLKVLIRKMEKVLKARRGEKAGFKGVEERVSMLQRLKDEKQQIDDSLQELDSFEPRFKRLLELRYIEGKSVEEVAEALHISRKTFDRWRPMAIEEYAEMVGMTY